MLLWTTGLSNKTLNHSDCGLQTNIDQSVYLADGGRTNDFLKSEHQPTLHKRAHPPDLFLYHPLCPGLCCSAFLLRPSHMLCSLVNINVHLKKGSSGSYLHLQTRVGGNPSAPKILIHTAGKYNCVMTGWREGASKELALNAGTPRGPGALQSESVGIDARGRSKVIRRREAVVSFSKGDLTDKSSYGHCTINSA